MRGVLDQLHRAGVISGLDRHLAISLCRLGGEQSPEVALAVAAVSRAVRQGHVCVGLSALAGRPGLLEDGRELDGFAWPALDDWRAAIEASALVASDPGSEPDRPVVLQACERLYLARYFGYQRALARSLLERAAPSAEPGEAAWLESELERHFPPAGERDPLAGQREAVRVALTSRLAIISGGPGTGKTTVVARILSALEGRARARGRPDPRVRLLAPTGKAAARLSEAIGLDGELQAATIHRTIGVDPNRPTRLRHDATRPLAADVVVVDEASMVDLALMAKLVDAVPSAARLILLGDRDQLASVEAGAIMGDLVPPESGRAGASPLSACVVQLSHSFRFGAASAIGRLARAIRKGDAQAALALLADDRSGETAWIEPEDPARLAEVLAPLIRRGYRPALAGDDPAERAAAFGGFRVLCALRNGPTGVAGLNGLVERSLRSEGLKPDGTWYAGRPVMIERNDYSLNLFNGDVGLTSPAGPGGALRVFFPGRDRPVAPGRLPACETAFACTAHKSQGSEFAEVVLVLPPRPSPVVTRELLYTAVTRARRRVTLVGSPDVLRAAIATPVQRASGLRELLWGA